MLNRKNKLIGLVVFAVLILLAIFLWQLLKPNPFDVPIRELSNRIEILSAKEESENTTVLEILNMIDQIKGAVQTGLVKVPQGQRESVEVTQNYFRIAENYLDAKEKRLKVVNEFIALSNKLKKLKESVATHGAAYASGCGGSLYSQGVCMQNLGIQTMADVGRFEELDKIADQVIKSETEAVKELAKAIEQANLVISKNAVVAMPAFDRAIKNISK